MLPLEKEEKVGKRNASEPKKERVLFLPPFLFFLLFYFPAEANGKCQYLEANGVSGYIWVANTFCSKKKKKRDDKSR